MYTLNILPLTNYIENLYTNHNAVHSGDSGLDLYFPKDIELESGSTTLIDLGFKSEMLDENGNNVTYILKPRSSIYKTRFRQSNSEGVIDAGYRGEIKVPIDCILKKDNILSNNISKHNINKGDRLFQLCLPNMKEFKIKIVDKLSNTTRGEGGFGSTGK